MYCMITVWRAAKEDKYVTSAERGKSGYGFSTHKENTEEKTRDTDTTKMRKKEKRQYRAHCEYEMER